MDNRSARSRECGSAESGRTITIDVVGDAFLRQMVRSIVAALLRVGRGEATEEDPGERIPPTDGLSPGAIALPRGLGACGGSVHRSKVRADGNDKEIDTTREAV